MELAGIEVNCFRSSHRRCSVKKVFLKISQNSQENTCARVSFLIKLQASGLRPATLLKKRLRHRCFPVNFVKFLRTHFFTERLRWLLLLLGGDKLIVEYSESNFEYVFLTYPMLKVDSKV